MHHCTACSCVACLCQIPYLRTQVLHGPILCCNTAHTYKKNLILRQRNLSKHCLLRFLCLHFKIPFSMWHKQHYSDHNKKLDHAEFLPFNLLTKSVAYTLISHMMPVSLGYQNTCKHVLWNPNLGQYPLILIEWPYKTQFMHIINKEFRYTSHFVEFVH